MNEEFYIEALAFLMDELEPAQRSCFEARLARDPAATAALKSISDALCSYVSSETPNIVLADEERAQLLSTLVESADSERRRLAIKAYFWPAAAAALLMLNIGQLFFFIHRHRVSAEGHIKPAQAVTVDLLDNGRNGENHHLVVYPAPPPLKKPGVVAASVTNISISQTTTVRTFTRSVYAWSVFDQARQQGSLDLHNLPEVPSGCSLELWVGTQGRSSFQRVGQIPSQFYGRSGSVNYKLHFPTASPVQIMITVERIRPAPPAVPSAQVVLCGP